jgi:hypothetical protein
MRYYDTLKTAIILAVILASIFSAPAAGAADGPASAGAGYLLRSVGPKSIAMGEVKAALDDDPFNWLANPAVLPAMTRSGLGLSHSEWIMDTRYTTLAGNARIVEWFTIGGGIVYENGKDIQGYDALGQMTESLKNYNYQAMLGLGFGPAASFSAGVNLKYFRESLADWDAGGFGIDLGAFYDIAPAGIKVGACVQNIGSDIKFIERKEVLPTTIRGGAVYTTPAAAGGIGFSLALDVVKPRFDGAYVGAGIEVELAGIVALRGGWTGQKNRSGDGFTFGAGVNMDDRIGIDYAAAPYGELGTMHRISLYFGIR